MSGTPLSSVQLLIGNGTTSTVLLVTSLGEVIPRRLDSPIGLPQMQNS
jgi:hypothetical protein